MGASPIIAALLAFIAVIVLAILLAVTWIAVVVTEAFTSDDHPKEPQNEQP